MHQETQTRAQKAIKSAIKEAGGASALARRIESIQCGERISPQAVSQWGVRKSGCPSNRVLQVEAVMQGKFTRHDLRPDLYPK